MTAECGKKITQGQWILTVALAVSFVLLVLIMAYESVAGKAGVDSVSANLGDQVMLTISMGFGFYFAQRSQKD